MLQPNSKVFDQETLAGVKEEQATTASYLLGLLERRDPRVVMKSSDLKRAFNSLHAADSSAASRPTPHLAQPVDPVSNERELNRRMLQADLDAWYSALSEHTYRSVFLPLMVEEAQSMMAVYKARISGNPASVFDTKLVLVVQHSFRIVCDH